MMSESMPIMSNDRKFGIQGLGGGGFKLQGSDFKLQGLGIRLFSLSLVVAAAAACSGFRLWGSVPCV